MATITLLEGSGRESSRRRPTLRTLQGHPRLLGSDEAKAAYFESRVLQTIGTTDWEGRTADRARAIELVNRIKRLDPSGWEVDEAAFVARYSNVTQMVRIPMPGQGVSFEPPKASVLVQAPSIFNPGPAPIAPSGPGLLPSISTGPGLAPGATSVDVVEEPGAASEKPSYLLPLLALGAAYLVLKG